MQESLIQQRESHKRKTWTRISFRNQLTTAELLTQDQALSRRIYRLSLTLLFALGVSGLIGWGRPTEMAGRWPAVIGAVLLVVATLLILVRHYHREMLAGGRTFTQFFLLVGSFLVVSWLLLYSGNVSPYLLPLPLLSMALALIYSPMLSLHVSLALSFLLALFYYPSLASAEHLPTQVSLVMALFAGSLVGVIGVGRIRTRTRLVTVGFLCGLAQFSTITIMNLWVKSLPSWQSILEDVSSLGFHLADPAVGFLNGIACGILMTSALPFIEDLFEVVTDLRLIELSDQNNQLLHQFALLAPGSWQHSLMVGQLAEEAALSIGANDLLARVGALYHDIGKMLKPGYFTENMRGTDNPHDRLSPEMSRLIIISHVKDGIAILKEEGLPRPIIDMVPMHHGTTVVEYFYNKKKVQDFERNERTERHAFQYPGPCPTFPEAAILMLADSTEAIARTLSEPTMPRLRSVVADVIRRRMSEGQLDDCNLTLRDLRRIQDAFVRVLAAIYHNRIRYQQPGEGGLPASSAPAPADPVAIIPASPAGSSKVAMTSAPSGVPSGAPTARSPAAVASERRGGARGQAEEPTPAG